MVDRPTFEAALARDGFAEVVEARLEPNQQRDTHDHAWETRGLVLAGEFRLHCDGAEATYRPGDVFVMAPDVDHAEASGPEGAVLVVGRKRL